MGNTNRPPIEDDDRFTITPLGLQALMDTEAAMDALRPSVTHTEAFWEEWERRGGLNNFCDR